MIHILISFWFSFLAMANRLSLRSLLDRDKLVGLNFDSWYRKLKIILKHERILYMLTDPTPKESIANAPHAARDTYMKWLNDCITVCCIIRVAMNDKLSHKFEDVQSKEMIQLLNKSFDILEDAERYKTSYAMFNTHMREGASVTDHVLYMIEQIECLNKFDFSFHEQLGKDAILNLLPKSYLSFLSHYRMIKPTVNYHCLLLLVQTFEKDHQLQKDTTTK